MHKFTIRAIQNFRDKHALDPYELDDFIQQIAPGLECYYFVCIVCNQILPCDEMECDEPETACINCSIPPEE